MRNKEKWREYMKNYSKTAKAREYFRCYQRSHPEKTESYRKWFYFKKLWGNLNKWNYSEKTKRVLISGEGIDERIKELMVSKEGGVLNE